MDDLGEGLAAALDVMPLVKDFTRPFRGSAASLAADGKAWAGFDAAADLRMGRWKAQGSRDALVACDRRMSADAYRGTDDRSSVWAAMTTQTDERFRTA
jgi:hypothetical protein